MYGGLLARRLITLHFKLWIYWMNRAIKKTYIRFSKSDDLFLDNFWSHEWKFDSQDERDQYIMWDNNNIYEKYLYHLLMIFPFFGTVAAACQDNIYIQSLISVFNFSSTIEDFEQHVIG